VCTDRYEKQKRTVFILKPYDLTRKYFRSPNVDYNLAFHDFYRTLLANDIVSRVTVDKILYSVVALILYIYTYTSGRSFSEADKKNEEIK